MEKAVVWFKEVGKGDIAVVGGKGANLGEMTQASIPVPPGFIVTSQAYYSFMEESRLTSKIQALLKNLDADNSRQLQETSKKIKQLISSAIMPEEIKTSIKKAYSELGQGLVAVRSSATAEDLPEASFAGQQSTYLNIEGEENVIQAVQNCWASLFESRAIYYREQQGYEHLKVGIAVPVQRMVNSRTSGVMFTVEPVTSDTQKMVIEAIYGLGEGLVSGEVSPDLYIIDKQQMKTISKKISRQEQQLTRNPAPGEKEPNIWLQLPARIQKQQKLTDAEILQLAEMGRHIEAHYGQPQDIEWARENNTFYIVQSRPVTALKESMEEEAEIDAPVLLTGDAASPGLASGPVRIILDPTQIDQVGEGDILVAEMTTPDFVPAMKRAAAIVTDRGGRTAHAAIVSRELGIPCVVGASQATGKLANDMVITVDGSHGKVYEGKVGTDTASSFAANVLREAIETKTRVYVNLAQSELAEMVASRNVDGVGLLRAEFMIAQIGEHPKYMLKHKRGYEFVEKLYNNILMFAKAFYPRPVVYRTTDFKTNEYRDLIGGREFEEVEENPMLGYRGASRYITDVESFKLEIEAIRRVRKDYPNLWVMIPFVRTIGELQATKDLLESEGLKRSKDFRLWMMVEVPSNIFLIDKFLSVGIDGISIGSNDLTQLILGIDRDSDRLAKTFDERNEAVLMALERAITISKEMGVTSSICGQAPSVYPELTEKLVSWGITSVSVSPDMIGTTREIIARAEAKLKK
ncbi:MAG: phosphoenolpyruvate synthase [Dehalococcoidales bacterium]|jgi:pyruvate,water dikinase|nr:phosphoenolpyruvate synthase [Dehalococcoidales bacterium]MDD3264336.1 phosphoenolpyruvate synthase [Dehalococcoidales bacterium]MDD4322102.1 phosphoenolpyruvate synthase [Dehalococcoidales bacterium]MDD4793672.1 phosphoenolpyruvate synthase [Dehalococcoidales bacterium]MDD5121774.1 phosphoenolpyruvate synthase [Dehalococcoidales bacterium]